MNRLTIVGVEHERMAELWRAGHVFSKLVSEPITYSCDELAKLQSFAEKQVLTKQCVMTKDASYWWRMMNWGTKWDVEEVVIVTATGDATMMQFNTAWSPPIAALRTMSGMYRKLRFDLKCCEPLWSFAAHVVFEAGEIVSEEYQECGLRYSQIAAECGCVEDHDGMRVV